MCLFPTFANGKTQFYEPMCQSPREWLKLEERLYWSLSCDNQVGLTKTKLNIGVHQNLKAKSAWPSSLWGWCPHAFHGENRDKMHFSAPKMTKNTRWTFHQVKGRQSQLAGAYLNNTFKWPLSSGLTFLIHLCFSKHGFYVVHGGGFLVTNVYEIALKKCKRWSLWCTCYVTPLLA